MKCWWMQDWIAEQTELKGYIIPIGIITEASLALSEMNLEYVLKIMRQ